MKSTIEINTKRLYLRSIKDTDAKDVFKYRSLPEVYQYQNWKPKTFDETKEFIEFKIEKVPNVPETWHQLAIIRSDSNEFVGDIGIHFLSSETNQVEIGFTLSPDNQGKGFAAEAIKGTIEYIFTTLNKHRIIASVDPRNTRSVKLLEKIGMRKEAHFKKSIWFNDEWADDLVYAILKEEWIVL